jgi:hypothetical protein
VFVRRIAVVVLVKHARAQLQPAEQTGIDELKQRAVDGGPADAK